MVWCEGNAQNNDVWFYQNTGTATQPTFSFVQTDFLVEDMVDLEGVFAK